MFMGMPMYGAVGNAAKDALERAKNSKDGPPETDEVKKTRQDISSTAGLREAPTCRHDWGSFEGSS